MSETDFLEKRIERIKMKAYLKFAKMLKVAAITTLSAGVLALPAYCYRHEIDDYFHKERPLVSVEIKKYKHKDGLKHKEEDIELRCEHRAQIIVTADTKKQSEKISSLELYCGNSCLAKKECNNLTAQLELDTQYDIGLFSNPYKRYTLKVKDSQGNTATRTFRGYSCHLISEAVLTTYDNSKR